jgi:threonine synthase
MDSLNPRLKGFSCARCASSFPIADYFEGCPSCRSIGFPASLAAEYERFPVTLAQSGVRGCLRFSEWLAYREWPSLGEGDTPIVELAGLARDLRVRRLFVKNEAQNPTGSHKDRMAMLAAARAREVGAPVVVVASSGNAGVAVAAYATAARLPCVVVAMPTMSRNWRRAVEATGAHVVATEHPASRWTYVQERVEKEGWYPVTNYLTPPVGSNPFGIDGFRTIAFELHDALGAANIDAVVVPTARGDLLWGIVQGFSDLVAAGHATSVPKVHAVEPFPRISAVLRGSDYRAAFPGDSAMVSIGGPSVTYQAVDALARCGGTAVCVRDADALDDQRLLAEHGLYFELSSAAALSGARQLRRDAVIGDGDVAVLIATSHGYKEDAAFDKAIPLVA